MSDFYQFRRLKRKRCAIGARVVAEKPAYGLGVVAGFFTNLLARRRALTLKHYFAVRDFLVDQKSSPK
jgi:hypothetical protein